MATLIGLVGGMILIAGWLAVVVVRRGRSRTTTVEGLLIERERAQQVRQARRAYDAYGPGPISGGVDSEVQYKYSK